MISYDTTTLLAAVDSKRTLFMGLSSVSMIFNYIYFYMAVVTARRDKVATFPLVCSTIWFAHDLSYVLSYGQWFVTLDHWYVKSFWYGLIPTTLLEAVYIHDFWRYGRQEMSPRLSRRHFDLFVVGAIVLGLIGWNSLKQFLDDPLYAYTFGATGFIAVAFGLPRMLRRGDAAGQSPITWIAYCMMQICWFTTTMLVFGPAFHQPWYLLLSAGSLVGGAIMAMLAHRWRMPAAQAA